MAKKKVIQMRVPAKMYRRALVAATRDTQLLIWTDHALQRMGERSLSTNDVLKYGRFSREPVWNDAKQSWEAVSRCLTSGRNIGVVTAIQEIKPGAAVVIVTAYHV